VAREVIDKYGDSSGRAMQHPVGTGPYRLKDGKAGHRIILEANPGYARCASRLRPRTPTLRSRW